MSGSVLSPLQKLLPFHFSHLSAGFIAVLVGYTSSVSIVFSAAHAAGATPEQIGSWLLALGVGMVAALADGHKRDAALITFLVTASGLSLFRIGSAFWGQAANWIARRRYSA